MKSIREIHDAFDAGSLSPIELTQSTLLAARTRGLGAYITLCEEKAVMQAKTAQVLLEREGKVPRGRMPLLGIPLGIKDNIVVEGMRTTCGSKILENYISPYTATSVERLEAAGAVILGKTNLDEFGMGSSNENSAYGPVTHPSHPDRVPGGSSGGSAAAVAAGLCWAALGTDTGGSIRLPASYCGVVGLKPTYGRVSRFGQVAYASSLDQIGPITRSVEDAALLLDVMSGQDPLDSTSSPQGHSQVFRAVHAGHDSVDWSKLRIGVPEEYWMGGVDPDVEAAIQGALEWLRSQGSQIVSVSLPHTKYAASVYYVIAVSEASSNLARMDGVRFGARPLEAVQANTLDEFYLKARSLFGPEVKRRILLGTFALSSGYSEAYYRRACQVRRKIQEDFNHAFLQADILLGPVSPTTAFKRGEKTKDPLQMYLNDIFTVPASLAGIPAMSLPCGLDSKGLPIGLQWMAPSFCEERLISVGQSYFVSQVGGKSRGR